jgi:molecular chaperone DnaK
VSRIKSAREALQQSFYKISEKIYSQAGAGAGAAGGPGGFGEDGPSEGPGGPSDSGPSDDNTVEGEFKEV